MRRRNPWFSPPAFQYVAWPNPPAAHHHNPSESHCRVCGSAYQQGYCPVCDWDYEDEEEYLESLEAEDNPGSFGPIAGPHAFNPIFGLIAPEAPPEREWFEENPFFGLIAPDAPPEREWFAENPLEFHAGGSHRYHGYSYPGSGRRHHHGRPPSQFHPGGGTRYDGEYHPGGGHHEANPLEFHAGGSHRFHGRTYPGSGRRHHHGRRPSQFHPGGGTRYSGRYHPGGGHYEANPLFGLIAPEAPPEREWFAENPFFGLIVPDAPPEREWFAENPPYYGPEPLHERDYVMIWGSEVPVAESKSGKYHHVRVADPDEFVRIRTKTLSASKGIKARIGVLQGRGPRGGRTEVQSYLFDAKMYTPGDVVRWVEGHEVPIPELVEFSPVPTGKGRRLALRPKKAPKKKPAGSVVPAWFGSYEQPKSKPAKKRKAKKKVKKKVAARKKSKKKAPPRRKRARKRKRAG